MSSERKQVEDIPHDQLDKYDIGRSKHLQKREDRFSILHTVDAPFLYGTMHAGGRSCWGVFWTSKQYSWHEQVHMLQE